MFTKSQDSNASPSFQMKNSSKTLPQLLGHSSPFTLYLHCLLQSTPSPRTATFVDSSFSSASTLRPQVPSSISLCSSSLDSSSTILSLHQALACCPLLHWFLTLRQLYPSRLPPTDIRWHASRTLILVLVLIFVLFSHPLARETPSRYSLLFLFLPFREFIFFVYLR